MPPTAQQLAKYLSADAQDAVEKGHKGSLTNFFAHAISQKKDAIFGSASTATSTAITAVAGVTMLAVSIATAGLAPAILIAIGGGTYALKKIAEAITFEMTRANRNWVAKYPSAQTAFSKEDQAWLNCQSADAVRRAVVHLKETIDCLNGELKTACETAYSTCGDVVNHAKAVAFFIHHADKTRNYLLPCLALCVWYLKQYKAMAESWDKLEAQYGPAMVKYFETHTTDCRTVGTFGRKSGNCYAPLGPGGNPIAPISTAIAVSTTMAPLTNSVDIDDLIGDLELMQSLIVNEMHLQGGSTRRTAISGPRVTPQTVSAAITSTASQVTTQTLRTTASTYNYSAQQRTVGIGSVTGAADGSEGRFKKLVEDCWKKVDQPGLLVRVGRKLSHAVTRRTGAEIVTGLLGEVFDIGGCFVPSIQSASALTEVAKSAISKSVTGANALVTGVALPVLGSKGNAAFASNMFNVSKLEQTASADVTASGASIEKMLPKVFTHFKNGAEAYEQLEKVTGVPLINCTQALALAKKVAELNHEMLKVAKYILPTIALLNYIAAQTYKWTDKENELWDELESCGYEFVATHAHVHCRFANTYCYGPKVNGQITVSNSLSHKPVT